MKYLITLLISGMALVATHAQNGAYIAAAAGIGSCAINTNITYFDQKGNSIERSALVSYNAGIGIGYEHKHWRFETGVQYLRTGYEMPNLLFGTDFDGELSHFATGPGKLRLTYNHIGIPLRAGYVFYSSRKINLVPYLGILSTYNTGARSVFNSTANTWSATAFDNRYNRISVWGTAALYLEGKVSSKVSLFGGSSLYYMISDFAKAYTTQRNYMIGVDLGLKMTL